MCARLYSCLCFLKQRSWGQGACPDSSLSALLQVRTSARGRSTACGPPTSAHGKPGWTLCHTLTKVTFIFRLLKGHSMTPGAGEEEEGEGSFLPFSFFFFFNLLPLPEKNMPCLHSCTAPSLDLHWHLLFLNATA